MNNIRKYSIPFRYLVFNNSYSDGRGTKEDSIDKKNASIKFASTLKMLLPNFQAL